MKNIVQYVLKGGTVAQAVAPTTYGLDAHLTTYKPLALIYKTYLRTDLILECSCDQIHVKVQIYKKHLRRGKGRISTSGSTVPSTIIGTPSEYEQNRL